MGGMLMVRLPGYGAVLEAHDPGIPERHAAAGVPDRFTDAIAWIVEDDGPRRWRVTFAVDDADDVARRAAQLGGTVSTAPHDEDGARLAVLRDPLGAGFTVSAWGG